MPQSYDKNDLAFATEVLEGEFFGAYLVAVETRKEETGLTQTDLASSMSLDKTNVSKLLSGPRNWKLSTVANLNEALDLRFEFTLVDRTNPSRRFTPTGVQYDPIVADTSPHISFGSAMLPYANYFSSNFGEYSGIGANPYLMSANLTGFNTSTGTVGSELSYARSTIGASSGTLALSMGTAQSVPTYERDVGVAGSTWINTVLRQSQRHQQRSVTPPTPPEIAAKALVG